MEVLCHCSFLAQQLGRGPSPAAALPFLPSEKQKQSKLQRTATNTKTASGGLTPGSTITYEIPTALWLLKVMNCVSCLESRGKKGTGWTPQKARSINSHHYHKGPGQCSRNVKQEQTTASIIDKVYLGQIHLQ